ncbi:MAG TPA: hypothetical protein VGV60_11005 [Candidatus Polarisedimenticolia bacterium]|jgi:hypothetical protein|nr:hypothetical protein [Candidatus Polarisedimenticolia bacterium]
MNARVITVIIAFCTGVSGVVLANMFLIMIIGEINRKRPDGNLESYFGYTLPKMLRIFREYRRLYPSGKLRIYFRAAFALAIISAVVSFVCLATIAIERRGILP